MAERIVSPGVFTQENDLSFLPVGIGEIGAVIIGRTQTGPAFKPVQVRSMNEFELRFGSSTSGTYVPFTVKEYIKSAGVVTIVRVLGLNGFDASDQVFLIASGSTTGPSGSTVAASTPFLLGVLHASANGDNATKDGLLAETNINFGYSQSKAWSDASGDIIGNDAGPFGGALTGNGQLSLTKFFGHLASVHQTASFDKTNDYYIPKLVGKGPGIHVPSAAYNVNQPASYVYSIFNSQSYGADSNNKGGGYSFNNASASLGSITFNAAAASVTGTNSLTSGKEYVNASTPWVISQTVNAKNFPLVKFHTVSDGSDSNRKYKISIMSIKYAGSIGGQDYGSFSVIVRPIGDTDNKVLALESYSNCNLDPSSPNYIARIIGDRHTSYDGNGKLVTSGDYPNISKFIRVECHANVGNAVYDESLIPFGNEAYISPLAVTNLSSSLVASYPAAALVTSRSLATDTTTYFGFNFNETILKNGGYNYLAPLSDNAVIGNNSNFLLENSTDGMATAAADPLIKVSGSTALNAKRFTIAFQGGFDGVNPAKQVAIGKDMLSTNTFGFSFASTTADGYVAYKKALDTVTNPDEIDINLIVTPGILTQNAANFATKVMDVCESRGDCFYVIDGVNSLNGDSVTAATTQAANYDTNYAAMYYPWVRVFDATINRFLFVPPSVVIPGVYSFNDKVAFPWFAPAGLNRGSLTTVTEPYTRLTHAERDDLYEGKVNPIAIFPNTGVCVWGQKTLQTKPSALDRINVRRLLIKLKKFIASSTRYLVFENNTTATRNRFLNIVNPYLETVQQQQGLYAFKVIMDESNNTPDVIDRNQMKGEIFLQPAKAAEFIIVDFNIMRTGASFEE